MQLVVRSSLFSATLSLASKEAVLILEQKGFHKINSIASARIKNLRLKEVDKTFTGQWTYKFTYGKLKITSPGAHSALPTYLSRYRHLTPPSVPRFECRPAGDLLLGGSSFVTEYRWKGKETHPLCCSRACCWIQLQF
jgi:hypothetical protein